MPKTHQIDAVRNFLKGGYESYEIVERPGELKHIFSLVRMANRFAEIHMMRSFWDDNQSDDTIVATLERLGLTAKITAAQGRPLFVWHSLIEMGQRMA